MKILMKLVDTLFLMRPPLLIPVWTVLILGWIAGNPDANMWSFSYGTLFINLIGFSLLVASIYVVNQIKDIDSDRINNKLFILPHGIISVPAAWVLAIVCTMGGLAAALTQGVWMFGLFALGFIVGVLYNLPPASLKNRAVGGVTANAIGHGAITFLVGWLSAKKGLDMNADMIKTGLLSSLAAAFANGAVFLATTIPDAPGDAMTGKKTFCVVYGEKATAIAATILCALALASSFLIENHAWVMVLPAALSLGIFLNFAVTANKNAAFYSFKWPVVLLSTFVALFVPVYGVLIIATLVAGRIYYKRRFNVEYPTFKAK